MRIRACGRVSLLALGLALGACGGEGAEQPPPAASRAAGAADGDGAGELGKDVTVDTQVIDVKGGDPTVPADTSM